MLLHSQMVRKRLLRAVATSSPYHVVANLGLAVDDSLLSADQTVQASHGGACKKEKKRQSVTTAGSRRRSQTGAGGDGGRHRAALLQHRDDKALSSLQHSARAVKAGMTMTLHFSTKALSLRCGLHSAGISQ